MSAWKDLEQLAEFLSRDSPIYAASFVREVRDAARSLNRFSQRDRIVPEYSDPDIRELFVRSYRLIYRISREQVEILSFIQGHRNCKPVSFLTREKSSSPFWIFGPFVVASKARKSHAAQMLTPSAKRLLALNAEAQRWLRAKGAKSYC